MARYVQICSILLEVMFKSFCPIASRVHTPDVLLRVMFTSLVSYCRSCSHLWYPIAGYVHISGVLLQVMFASLVSYCRLCLHLWCRIAGHVHISGVVLQVMFTSLVYCRSCSHLWCHIAGHVHISGVLLQVMFTSLVTSLVIPWLFHCRFELTPCSCSKPPCQRSRALCCSSWWVSSSSCRAGVFEPVKPTWRSHSTGHQVSIHYTATDHRHGQHWRQHQYKRCQYPPIAVCHGVATFTLWFHTSSRATLFVFLTECRDGHRAYTTKIQGIKRPFCLNTHRVADLALFPIQSVENKVLTQGWSWLSIHQAGFGFVLFSLKKEKV